MQSESSRRVFMHFVESDFKKLREIGERYNMNVAELCASIIHEYMVHDEMMREKEDGST